jgi:hypothetical protein
MSPLPGKPKHIDPALLLGLAVLVPRVLGFALYVATIPIVCYLTAAALLFSGLLAPAFGCRVLGVLASPCALARGA